MATEIADAVKFASGEKVFVFYRCGDRDSYMPVSSWSQGLRTPRVGQTHGWVSAVVTHGFDSSFQGSEVRVRYLDEKWVDRTGDVLNPNEPRNMFATHHFSRVRLARPKESLANAGHHGGHTYLDDENNGMSRIECTISAVFVRWADENCDEVKEGDSGWGPTGAVVSDSYISFWLDALDAAFPHDYQVMTIWIASSEDMTAVSHIARTLKHLLHGRHHAAMYFLWPAQCLDAQFIPSGYVDLPCVMAAMTSMEGSGISTRFPHTSHLYKLFLSKDWTSQLCLFPEMCIPATTKVSRSMVEKCPLTAASHALAALARIKKGQSDRRQEGQPVAGKDITDENEMEGVAKLGYSWEANDVLRFKGHKELAVRLTRLFNQPQGTAEFAFVQDLIVDFDCEVRTFVVNGKPITNARRYTSFAVPALTDQDGREAGRYSDFARGGRDMALQRWMGGNDAALKNAEEKVDQLIEKYCLWLQTECCDIPTVFRFDAFLRRRPDGKTCDVFSGELTELGACTLGWDLPDMVATLFPAVLASMLSDQTCQSAQCKCKSSADCKGISVDRMVRDIRNRYHNYQQYSSTQQHQFDDNEEEEGGEEGEQLEHSTDEDDGGGMAEEGGIVLSPSEKKKRRNKAKKARLKAQKEANS